MQAAQILWDVVGQPAIFRSRPDLLDRVQLRGIGHKPFDPESPWKAFLQSTRRCTMDAPTIQNPDDSPREVIHNFDGEGLKILMANVAWIHPEKQGQLSPVGRYTQGRNHRQPIPSSPRIQNRGLATGTPSSTNQRLQHKPAFISENDATTRSAGFFLYEASPVCATFRRPVRRVP